MKGIEQFKEVKRLIIVAAHPDDLETMVGGSVVQLTERGVHVFSVNCTLGDIGTPDPSQSRPALASTRLSETEEAARILGIERTFNLGHHDGELVPDLTLRAQIARLYRLTQADTLWSFDPHWTGQIHPDHRAAGQAAIDAYMPSKMPLYHPEQLGDPEADLGCLERIFVFAAGEAAEVCVDVMAVYEQKMAACKAHLSQFPNGDESLEWMKELDKDRGEPFDIPLAETFNQVRVW